jgi:hypothetical protein
MNLDQQGGHMNKNLRAYVVLTVAVAVMTIAAPAMAQGTLFVKNDKVGIGVDDPQFKLHVQRDDGGGAGFEVSTTGATANFDWFFQQNAVTGAFLVTPHMGGNAPLQVFPGLAGTIANTLVIRGGKVGIGTQNPAGKLDVNGPILQRGGVLHADYVFEADYQLESIEDHAAFMWENKHLPAVGKATYDADGTAVVEIGARSQGMLEELEKAHIYIEELNQELKQLREVVSAQQELLEKFSAQ